MSTRRYVTIMFSAAALLATVSLPQTASATDLPVPTRVVEKSQVAPVARPAFRAVRKKVRFARRAYGPVRYVSRPRAVPVQFALLERRWVASIMLGVGY